MKKFRLIRFFALAFCLLQFAIPNLVMACPTCKDGLHDDGTAAAYAVSILFMMGMPFLIFTCWIVTIFRLRAKVAVEDGLNQPIEFASGGVTQD